MSRDHIDAILAEHKPEIYHCRNVSVEPIKARNRELIKNGDIEYYVRNYKWIISNDSVDSHGTYMDPETTLPKFAIEASKGVPIQKNHDYRELQLGISTKGTFNSDKNEVVAEGYIQEGLQDVNSDDVIARLDTGACRWVSVGFRGDEVCSYCGTKMHWFWSDCENGHYIYQKIMIDKDGNETDDPDEMKRTETIYAKVVDGELLEFSPVWRGSNPDAELIGEVRRLFEKDNIDSGLEKRLSRRFGVDVRSLLLNKDKSSNKSKSIPKRSKIMGDEKTVLQEDYDQLSKELNEALSRVVELEKRPTREDYDATVNDMTTQIADVEKELAEVRSELKDSSDNLDEIPVAVAALRKDALDAFADASGLSTYERDSSEEYQAFKDSIEGTDSLMRLINKRRHYELRNRSTNGGRKMYSREEEQKTEKPAPVDFPTEGAFNII